MPDQARLSGANDPAGGNSDRAPSAQPAGEPPGRRKSVVCRRRPVRDEVVLPRDHAAVAERTGAMLRSGSTAVLLLSLTSGRACFRARYDNAAMGRRSVWFCSMSPPSRRCTRFSARCSIRSRKRRGRRRLRPALPRRKRSSPRRATASGSSCGMCRPRRSGRWSSSFMATARSSPGASRAFARSRPTAPVSSPCRFAATRARRGKPTEQGLLDDGAAAYDFAAARYAPARIVPWGYSLGSGVAIAVATTQPVGGVVLEAPYTSIVDVAAGAYPDLSGALVDARPISFRPADRRAEGAVAGDARRKGHGDLRRVRPSAVRACARTEALRRVRERHAYRSR